KQADRNGLWIGTRTRARFSRSKGGTCVFFVDLRGAVELGLEIRIPAGAFARGLGEFIATLQPGLTAPDVVDAHVALVTRATRSLVWTSDPDDMLRYQAEPRFMRRL